MTPANETAMTLRCCWAGELGDRSASDVAYMLITCATKIVETVKPRAAQTRQPYRYMGSNYDQDLVFFT